jgi:hypothetical protein
VNAADCLLAAKNCEPTYRSVMLAISAAWYALAVQDEEIDRMLAKGEPASVRAPGTAEILAFPISARSILVSPDVNRHRA